ncbi:DNA-3-methyladenine glycosylase [Flavihumibacter stibioxidans]
MYRRGGTAYVYLCYGIHHLFNIVTNVEYLRRECQQLEFRAGNVLPPV